MTPSLHLNMYICMFGIFVGFFFLFFLVVVAERGDGNSLPHGMDEAVIEVPRNKLLRVVLVSPQTTSICHLAPRNIYFVLGRYQESQVALTEHVQHRLLRYAYLGYVVVKVQDSWAELLDYFRQQEGDKRLLAFTKRGTTTHSGFSYI
ncbi:uncharacterized protein LOC110643682 isoform X2 [Hevea brasiliensis]|uniref:uncharacterized protein LOC110643682 isoform X2 n=1 Tax=Hevea brasiliensis TaxID=3981 RepID=UPI0025D7A19C|nr:uncharacterized protein LOC110643682 isoform X2 [Hevea brasiliensis]